MFILALFLLVTASARAEQPADRIPLEELLPPSTLQRYVRETKYHNKIEKIRKAVEIRAKRLKDEIEDRDLAVIFRTLAEIRGLSQHTIELSKSESNEKEQRHKEVKKLEITLRKLNEQLGDQKLEVPLENRGQFEETQVVVETLRDLLLRQLFGKAVGSLKLTDPVLSLMPRTSAAKTSVTLQGLHDIDKFTEDEFLKIQEAQKLGKRVDAFLEIAEFRLDEIERRRDGVEWDEEEPNPCEFYTYEELLHAYVRAIDGIMINIDEKAQRRMESKKDIRKSLEKLFEKVSEFIPRLRGIEELVRSQRDRGFYRKYQAALKSSDIAQKGARYGLGAVDEKR